MSMLKIIPETIIQMEAAYYICVDDRFGMYYFLGEVLNVHTKATKASRLVCICGKKCA